MHSYIKVWREGLKASRDEVYLHRLKEIHGKQVSDINSAMMSMKRKGHVMGCDLRNRLFTGIHVPNRGYVKNRKEHSYNGVMEMKTIRLEHRITSNLIKRNRRKLYRIMNNEENIDNEFAWFAMLWKDAINTSRILKQAEIWRGEILRDTVLSIRKEDNQVELY